MTINISSEAIGNELVIKKKGVLFANDEAGRREEVKNAPQIFTNLQG